jgi:hypothetical protein
VQSRYARCWQATASLDSTCTNRPRCKVEPCFGMLGKELLDRRRFVRRKIVQHEVNCARPVRRSDQSRQDSDKLCVSVPPRPRPATTASRSNRSRSWIGYFSPTGTWRHAAEGSDTVVDIGCVALKSRVVAPCNSPVDAIAVLICANTRYTVDLLTPSSSASLRPINGHSHQSVVAAFAA